jgi:hypothetical protein
LNVAGVTNKIVEKARRSSIAGRGSYEGPNFDLEVAFSGLDPNLYSSSQQQKATTKKKKVGIKDIFKKKKKLDYVAELTKLVEMKENGHITEEEFGMAKHKLLS